MKAVIIYYSYEGNSVLVADTIRDAIHADSFEIKTVDRKKWTGFAMYVWGGAQVVFGKRPRLEPLAVDLGAYDLVILGTPVWAGSPAPAVLSFLDKVKPSGKKIALFCCHGGGMRDALKKLKAHLSGNTIVSEIDFVYPLKNQGDELKQKINGWAKTLV